VNLTAQRAIRGIYAITPEVQGAWSIQAVLECIQAAVEAGVRLVQCRQKGWSDDDLGGLVLALSNLCAPYAAHLIVNDVNAEQLLMWNVPGVDGVHLGKDDEPVDSARLSLPAGLLIGASCYNQLALAEHAVKKGADYIAFGAVFSSTTKPAAVSAPLSLFAQAQHLAVPKVAIGGITLDKVGTVVQAGADALAVVSGLFGSQPNPMSVRRNTEAWVSAFEHALQTKNQEQK
jgi:thiamine-phosphate pyrophosphorylase